MKILLILMIGLLAVSVNAQSEKQSKKIEDAVKKVINEQVEAWNRGDIDAFMEGYWKSEDMRFVSGNKVSKGWQSALDNYKRGYPNKESMGTLSFSELEFTVLSKKSVLVQGRFLLVRTTDKPTGLFSLVFRKIDGSWKIIHDHTSS